jgi:hypothetical protein
VPAKPAHATLRMSRRGPKLTPGRFRAVEDEYSIELPEDYRRFMLRTNGGIPEPCYYIVRTKRAQSAHWVSWLAAITSRPALTDPLSFRGMNHCLWRYHVGGTPAPSGAVVIGRSEPAVLLLFVAGKRRGEVWVKDWDRVDLRTSARPDPEAGMTRLARSFSEFLGSLMSEEQAQARLGRSASRRR